MSGFSFLVLGLLFSALCLNLNFHNDIKTWKAKFGSLISTTMACLTFLFAVLWLVWKRKCWVFANRCTLAFSEPREYGLGVVVFRKFHFTMQLRQKCIYHYHHQQNTRHHALIICDVLSSSKTHDHLVKKINRHQLKIELGCWFPRWTETRQYIGCLRMGIYPAWLYLSGFSRGTESLEDDRWIDRLQIHRVIDIDKW